jgi:hypothetical protein
MNRLRNATNGIYGTADQDKPTRRLASAVIAYWGDIVVENPEKEL